MYESSYYSVMFTFRLHQVAILRWKGSNSPPKLRAVDEKIYEWKEFSCQDKKIKKHKGGINLLFDSDRRYCLLSESNK